MKNFVAILRLRRWYFQKIYAALDESSKQKIFWKTGLDTTSFKSCRCVMPIYNKRIKVKEVKRTIWSTDCKFLCNLSRVPLKKQKLVTILVRKQKIVLHTYQVLYRKHCMPCISIWTLDITQSRHWCIFLLYFQHYDTRILYFFL